MLTTSLYEAICAYKDLAGLERADRFMASLPQQGSADEERQAFSQLRWLYGFLTPLLLRDMSMGPLATALGRLDPVSDLRTVNNTRCFLGACGPHMRSMCGVGSGSAQALFGISLVHAGEPVSSLSEVRSLAATCIRSSKPYVVAASTVEASVVFSSVESLLTQMVCN